MTLVSLLVHACPSIPGPAPQVLIVDDDVALAASVAEAIARMGCATVVAHSGQDLLRYLTAEAQLIVLDLVMPELDGIELLRYLFAAGCTAELILVSALGTRILESAEELGASLGLKILGHLTKPFCLARLEAIVARWRSDAYRPDARNKITGSPASLDPADEEVDPGLDRHEFVPFFQPQIELGTGEMIGMEALVRWRHPTLGYLAPARFLHYFDQPRRMERLTWQMLEQAIAALQRVSSHCASMPTLSVNLSVSALSDLSLPNAVAALLRRHGVAPDRLALEITEGGLIGDPSIAMDVLTRLRLKGIRLSVDDFGTGYAMMQQLRSIPANELKIDRSFITRLAERAGDRVMVQKMVEMAHGLGLKVVAEGVETSAQLAMLRRDGCDFAQGYLFSPPLAEPELVRWMSRYAAA